MSGEDVVDNGVAMNTLGSSNTKSENGTLPLDVTGVSTVGSANKRRKSQLRMGKKIYEFYNAPVTKFWLHTIGYLTFLCIFMYTVLAKLRETPEWQELYVMASIATLFVEKLRQVVAQEPVKMSMKIHMFLSRIWNLWDLLAIALFCVGACLRFFPSRVKDAHLVYVVDVVLWNTRILEILSVNQYLGPYVKIIAKLIRDMAYYLIILFIAVTSYGVVRQAVQYQNESVSWTRTLRNVWFYPYWMIYGELFAEEIDPCEENEASCSIYAAWVSPAIMCLYLLIANILGVNLLIARFNATFIKNNAYSREIWMFQRYQLIIEHEMRPIFPPPLIIITHLYLAFKYICRRCKGKRDYFDNGLKLFLSRDDTEKVHDFEEECMEDFFREKENKFQSSSEERIRVINDRVETMSLRLEDVNTKESSLRLSIQTIDYRLGRLEEIATNTHETLTLLRSMMSRQFTPPPSTGAPSVTPSRRSSNAVSVAYSFSRDDASEVDGDGQYRDPSPGPSLLSLRMDSLSASAPNEERELRCMPSPMLVHSSRPTREEHLRRFTNYSHARQLSGESFSRMSVDEADSNQTNQEAQHFMSVPERPLRATLSDTTAVLTKDSHERHDPSSTTLQQRRSGANKLSLDVSSAQTRVRSSSMSPAVRFQDPVVHAADFVEPAADAGEGIFSTARIQTGTSTATTPRLAELDLSHKQQQLNIVKGFSSSISSSISTPISPDLGPLSPSHVHTSTDAFTTPDPDVLPSAAVRDLCSVFVPHHGEYYTITDNIDVSCFRSLSPPRSPVPSASTTSTAPLTGMPRKRAESTSSKVKQEELMAAEETERHKMEGLIRHRLRQISQDDSSGSISDIARLVVSEMDINHSSSTPPEEEDENSDDDDSEGKDVTDSSAGLTADPVV